MQRTPVSPPAMMMRQQQRPPPPQQQQSARRRRPTTTSMMMTTTTQGRRDGLCTVFLRISLVGVILWMMYSHKLEVERQTELIEMHQALPMMSLSSSIPIRASSSQLLHLQQLREQRARNAAVVVVPPEVKIVQDPQLLPKDVDDKDNVAPPPPDIHDSQPTVTSTVTNTTTNTPYSTSSSRHGGVSPTLSIPIFYNLYVRNDADVPRVEKIVDEQLQKLIEGVHGPVYVNAIGASLLIPNTTLIGRYEEASEMVTLQSLWEYCRNPKHYHQKVVYLHSKGSYTNNLKNGRLRRFLTTGALSQECANLPEDTCNVCSSRFSPVPHPHTSGNMWLARCSYVQHLIEPNQFAHRMKQHSLGGGPNYAPCDGRGRYAAEHWIHSHPTVRPCDLYKDAKFTWNYNFIPKNKVFIKNIDLQPAPRFELEQYVVPKMCPGRGTNIKHRLREYQGLYNQLPPETWWGYNFLKESAAWPYHDFGWKYLPKKQQGELETMGFSGSMWDRDVLRGRPYAMYGKNWTSLEPAHRETLVSSFGYTKEMWAKETRKEIKDVKRIEDAAATKVPIEDAFGRCKVDANITPWLQRDQVPNSKANLRDYVYEAAQQEDASKPKRRVLIISAVPRDETHILSLWSELECFSSTVNHVLLSAPKWGEPFIKKVIAMAKKYIPHFKTEQVTIESKFYLNSRYDVGLWCDALESLKQDGKGNEFEEYGLINDSVFALREFSGILDNLVHKNVHMTSLGYSFTGKWFDGYGPEHYWVESVFRGFDQEGIDIFSKHSCVPEDHPFFCPDKDDNKACIINNFEHDLVGQYACDKVHGLFPSDAPEGLKFSREVFRTTWIKNLRYWRFLVQHMGFPIAKVNEPEHVGSPKDVLLKNCTKHYPPTELFDGMNFGVAKPFYQQKWTDLSPEFQLAAQDTLGYNLAKWNLGGDTQQLAHKKWRNLTKFQRETLEKLECTQTKFNRNECHHVDDPDEAIV